MEIKNATFFAIKITANNKMLSLQQASPITNTDFTSASNFITHSFSVT
jgi:hypothetical protein